MKAEIHFAVNTPRNDGLPVIVVLSNQQKRRVFNRGG
jgi:hypothetical protein